MASNKQLVLDEITKLTEDLKKWSSEAFSWGPIRIDKVESDVISVSTNIGNFSFTSERAVVEFIIMNIGKFK